MIHGDTYSERYHFAVALERQLNVKKEENPFYIETSTRRNEYIVFGNEYPDITNEDLEDSPYKQLAFLILKNVTYLNDGKHDRLEKLMLKTYIEKRKKELNQEEYKEFKKIIKEPISKSTVRDFVREYRLSPKIIMEAMEIVESYLDFNLSYVNTVNEYYQFLRSI